MPQDVETVSSPPDQRLAAGQSVLGGRYTIESFVREGPLASMYHATDGSSGDPVTLHVLSPALARRKELVHAISELSKAAAAIDHKNVARVLHCSTDGPAPMVVTEYLDGNPVSKLLERKRQTGRPGFGARGSKNILSSVCSALDAAHPALPHGGVGPDSIFVSKAGRVKVVDFGLAAATPAAARAGIVSTPAFLAPDAKRTGKPSVSADVFALGHLLYELVVGHPLKKGGKRPSDVEGVPPSVDELVACCVAGEDKRLGSAKEVRDGLVRALAQVSGAHPTSGESTPSLSRSMPVLGGANAGQRRVSLAQEIAQPHASGTHAVDDALAAAMADTEERWLVSKGKLDYGPFTLTAVVEEIRADQIVSGHVIIDKHTGERMAVEDHPLLHDVVDQAKQERDHRRRADAEEAHHSQEKRRGVTLYAFIAVGVILIGSLAYVVVGKLSGSKKQETASNIGSLEGGELRAKLTFPKASKRRRSTGKRRRRRTSGNAASGNSDEPMALDMSEDGGDERLDNNQINRVVGRYGGKLGRCLGRTGSSYAKINFSVRGKDGRVTWVKVNGKKSGSLFSCVNSVMRSMKFPTFDGTRTRADFDMSL